MSPFHQGGDKAQRLSHVVSEWQVKCEPTNGEMVVDSTRGLTSLLGPQKFGEIQESKPTSVGCLGRSCRQWKMLSGLPRPSTEWVSSSHFSLAVG